jgi:hypothetical protein
VSVDVGVEAGAKKTFAWLTDWPGWCRSGKTEGEALERLVEYRDRYEAVARAAGLTIPTFTVADLDVVDRLPGGPGTDFGVPSSVGHADRRATDAREAKHLAGIVAATWTILDDVVASAPAELRKGPRGGGRDRDKAFGHTVEADQAYAREMGIKRPGVDATDRVAIDEMRGAMLEALRGASDGSPMADRKWPPRYAARRIAWHALDHAWEIEDRSDPAG